MANFIMMVGIPGAGKSTIVEKYRNMGYNISCPDTFRGIFSPVHNEADQSVNVQAWEAAKKLVVESLSTNNNVVLDATEIYPKGRKAIMDILPDCHKTAVYVKVELATALRRNYGRQRKVPEKIIKQMFNNLVEPSIKEGFDKIIVVEND